MGVKGIRLPDMNFVVALIVIVKNYGMILLATSNGFGKRTEISEFKIVFKGSNGVIAIQTSKRNGFLVGAIQIFINDVMLISNSGILVRINSGEISKLKRNAQGDPL